MMKNIVFLNSCPVWGGGEKWTFTTAKALAKDPEYKVYIATGRDTELARRSAAAGLEVQPVNIKSGITVLNFVKTYCFVKFLQTKQIDIMFLNMSQDLKFGGITGKLANLDKVIYRRGLAVPIKNRFYNKYLFKNCLTDIIANSLAVKDSLLKYTEQWLKEDKITIIYNGINFKKVNLAIGNRQSNIREEFNLNAETTIIANVGRLTEQKGHTYLIKAVDLLAKKANDFKVLIIGTGPLLESIEQEISNYDLNDKFILTGFRDDIYNILEQSDFLVHTALWEGCPNTILEAMGVGLPIVAVNIDSVKEVMIDNKTGFLAENKNYVDIADKIEKMIFSQKKDYFSKQEKLLVKNKFSFKIMIEEVKKLLE